MRGLSGRFPSRLSTGRAADQRYVRLDLTDEQKTTLEGLLKYEAEYKLGRR